MVIESLLQVISTHCHYLIRIPWFFSCQEWFLKLPLFWQNLGHTKEWWGCKGFRRSTFSGVCHWDLEMRSNEIKWANAHKPRNILSCCTHIKTYLYNHFMTCRMEPWSKIGSAKHPQCCPFRHLNFPHCWLRGFGTSFLRFMGIWGLLYWSIATNQKVNQREIHILHQYIWDLVMTRWLGFVLPGCNSGACCDTYSGTCSQTCSFCCQHRERDAFTNCGSKGHGMSCIWLCNWIQRWQHDWSKIYFCWMGWLISLC